MINVNPAPQRGVLSPFGMVPGPLEAITPPSPYADLSAVTPGLAGMNTAATGDVLGQLSGNLSPGTLSALRNAAATWGVNSGTGMGTFGIGPLAENRLFGNVAGFAENQVNKGLENYSRLIPTISSTQTLAPGLNLQGQEFNTQIAAQNALNAAAPNPAIAQSYAQQLFSNYLNSMRSPSGGTGRMAPAPADNSWMFGPAPGTWQGGTGPAGGVEFAGTYMAPEPTDLANAQQWAQRFATFGEDEDLDAIAAGSGSSIGYDTEYFGG
jgi:hypothetical protein